MATELSVVNIGAADRSPDVLRVELWRTINGVGNWMAILRNTDGVYNGVFDVQDQFLLNVNGAANTIYGGRADGPAVTLRGRDLESDWDEYVIVKGVDQAQDLLFHNDFDYDYPDVFTQVQQVKDIWDDVINTQLVGLTNITYAAPVGATPVVGSMEFKEGTNFLAATQDLFRRAGYIFYVDDNLAFQSGAPGFSASAEILTSVAGDSDNNILDIVDYQERDGDKHYNYVKLYGKNPMFDGYTEGNVTNAALTGWDKLGANRNLLDDTGNVKVGAYSQVAVNTNSGARDYLVHTLTAPVFNYTTWDFTKGTIGCWGYYDNTSAAPGNPVPQAGNANPTENGFFRLYDSGGLIADYYGASTLLYEDEWGWMSAPLGESYGNAGTLADEWYIPAGAGSFDWKNIQEIRVSCPTIVAGAARNPSHFYIDGLTIPVPCIAIDENAGAQAVYRKRPFVDYYQHVNTQNALVEVATQLLEQTESTEINKINLTTSGNEALRYAGQSVTVNIPSMGLTNTVMYMTQIHHIIEPYIDVSGGFGFDWITEIEAVPTGGVAYDMSRLRDGSFNSGTQNALRAATGLRRK